MCSKWLAYFMSLHLCPSQWRKARGKNLHSFKGQTQKRHTTVLFTSYWPEIDFDWKHLTGAICPTRNWSIIIFQ
jgi:hypothetical protein